MVKVRLSFLEKQKAARLGLLPEKINPLIIVPGLLGSWPPAFAPVGRVDPISGAYVSLIDGLRTLGYRPNVSLFLFPYDWRLSIEEAGRKLGAEIQRIRKLPNLTAGKASPVAVDYSRVDLLAHSLGGLVSRAYAQSEACSGEVARLITVASPHQGLIAAYYAWEGGDSTYIGLPVEAASSMISLLSAREIPISWKRIHTTYRIVRKQISADVYQYLTMHTPSIQDLLPTPDAEYLYSMNENRQSPQVYPFGPEPGYPVNQTLQKLNSPAMLEKLAYLESFELVYSSSNRTPLRLQVADNYTQSQPLFQHGQPLATQPAENFGEGDGIVAAYSASLDLPAASLAKVPLRRTNLNQVLKQPLNHIAIVGDPDPVRYLLSLVARQLDHTKITAQVWDGPLVSKRRPNIVALFR
jgi:hypothetical protein